MSLTNLHEQLQAGDAPDKELFIARAMDFDGINENEIQDLAARIGLRFNAGERYSNSSMT